MRRLGFVGLVGALTAALGCAATTRSNPAGPPPASKQTYAGRIVLSSPRLPDEVEAFDRYWSRRLSILGLPSRIVYDDTRAVFDIYGAPAPALAVVAGRLADPGGWMGRALDGVSVVDWMPATPACDCGGQMSLAVSGEEACGWATTTASPVEIPRPGSHSLWVAGWRVTWHFRIKLGANLEGYAEGESETRKDLKCPEETWPKVVVRLLPGTTSEQGAAIALAFGGGRLPETPRIDSIAPAVGAGPR